MKTACRLVVAAAALLVALPAAADDYKFKQKHKHKHGPKHAVEWRGGPPPWAPAHGYRRKAGQQQPQMAYVPPLDLGFGRCNRDVVGGILGAAAGGLLGAQIGDGRGQLAATAAGAVAGMLLGAQMGGSLDRADYYCMGQALEYAPERQPVVWQGGSGREYRITPTQTYQVAGAYCREYQTTIMVGGRAQQGYGTACRMPDGSWKVTD